MASPRPLHVCLTFAPLPSTVFWARKLTVDQLNTWGAGEAADVVELIVSELLTNAIKAMGGIDAEGPAVDAEPVRLRYSELTKLECVRLGITFHRTVLLVEVWDSNPNPPVPHRADVDDESGRGLSLIAALSLFLKVKLAHNAI